MLKESCFVGVATSFSALGHNYKSTYGPPLPRDVAPSSSITTTRMTINTSSAHPHKTYLYRLRLIRFSLDAG